MASVTIKVGEGRREACAPSLAHRTDVPDPSKMNTADVGTRMWGMKLQVFTLRWDGASGSSDDQAVIVLVGDAAAFREQAAKWGSVTEDQP